MLTKALLVVAGAYAVVFAPGLVSSMENSYSSGHIQSGLNAGMTTDQSGNISGHMTGSSSMDSNTATSTNQSSKPVTVTVKPSGSNKASSTHSSSTVAMRGKVTHRTANQMTVVSGNRHVTFTVTSATSCERVGIPSVDMGYVSFGDVKVGDEVMVMAQDGWAQHIRDFGTGTFLATSSGAVSGEVQGAVDGSIHLGH